VSGIAGLERRGIHFLVAESTVSFGAKARSVLAKLHLTAALHRATTTSRTPGQIAARVAAGRTDGGLVYASDLTAAMRSRVHVLTIPAAGAPAVTFEIAVVRRTRNGAAAQAYVARVLSPTGQAALRRRGFGRA
jgi:molybdate transport system substrate-binding protein